MIASKSPSCSSGISRSSAKKSPDSHTGPTISIFLSCSALAHKFTLTWRFASASPFEGEGFGEGARLNDRHDFVIALVQRGPDEIVHAGIHNRELFYYRFA